MADNLRTLIRLLVNYLLEGKDPPPSYLEKLLVMRNRIQKKLQEGGLSRIEELLLKDSISQIDMIVNEIRDYYEFKDGFRRYILGISQPRVEEEFVTQETPGEEAPQEETKEYPPKESPVKLLLVVFKEDVPKFVGEDLKVYGPFSKGDVAWIPEGNVKILERRGVIEVVA